MLVKVYTLAIMVQVEALLVVRDKVVAAVI